MLEGLIACVLSGGAGNEASSLVGWGKGEQSGLERLSGFWVGNALAHTNAGLCLITAQAKGQVDQVAAGNRELGGESSALAAQRVL